MIMQIRMTAICENEIVTLRGEACLVQAGLGSGQVSDILASSENGLLVTQRDHGLHKGRTPRGNSCCYQCGHAK
jgi:hypothetical protein